MLPPLFPPIPRPMAATPGSGEPGGGVASAVLPCVLSEVDAEVLVREAVTGRALAPADADRARIEEPRLLSVPFWRIEVSVDGALWGGGWKYRSARPLNESDLAAYFLSGFKLAVQAGGEDDELREKPRRAVGLAG